MVDNILKFKSEKAVKPIKVRISQSKNSPSIELSTNETLAIQKFLNFVKKDVQFQMKLFKDAKLPQEKLEQNLSASAFLIEYMNVLLDNIEKVP